MQLKYFSGHLAAIFYGTLLCGGGVYANAAATDVSYNPPLQPAASKSASLDPFKQMSLDQQHSLNLLLQNYQDCFLTSVRPSHISDLPNAIEVDIFERHNQDCGGDPNTMPRQASYLIDGYGRIFYQNMRDSTLDLQFQFNEVAVTITDMAQFQHPIKAVFNHHGIHLQQVEKRAAGSFVIFYVADIPLLTDSQDKQIAQSRQQLFQQLLKANGDWDFMIRCEDGHDYYIEGSKRKVIDRQSYRTKAMNEGG